MNGYCNGAAQKETPEEKALSEMSRYLRWEKKAWKILGIVFLVLSVVITLGGLFVLVAGIIYADQPNNGYIPMPSVFSLMAVGAAYLTNAWLVYIPIAIINLIMANKINYYQEAVYTDLPAARKRCGSVGMMVFGYLFNKIALIFIIINFIRTKNNAAALDGIEAGQKGLNI